MSKPLYTSLAEFIEGCGHAVTIVPFPDNANHHALRFMSKGQRFQVNVYGDDSGFLYVTFSCHLPEKRAAEDVLRRIALEVQGALKAVKISLDGELVVSAVEQLIVGDSFAPIFWRSADLAQGGARMFFERLGHAPAVDTQSEVQAAAQRFLSELGVPKPEPGPDDGKRRVRPRKRKAVTPGPRTSVSDPLRIAEIASPAGGGLIGVTLCPGKKDAHAATGSWERDLGADLDRIRAWGARAVVTLLGDRELVALRVGPLRDEVKARGMEWFRLPMVDGCAPDADFEELWEELGPKIRAMLKSGERVLVHCRGGLGRAGTVAASILVELGEEPDAAIGSVRAARPGAIQTLAQEAYIRHRRHVSA
ncbi:MAG: cyclin-dependent kinase inhibitor 3 family protein [Vulcanimicrobiaceae bacterium]